METQITFDDFVHKNGDEHWLASQLMKFLGYPDMKSFRKPIDRATQAMAGIGGSVDPYKEIQPHSGQKQKEGDYRLTRFACYMIAMNADPKKTEVARAQVYFAEIAQEIDLRFQNHSLQIDRLSRRQDFTKENKALNSVASQAGVKEFDKFANAGYLGMYNLCNYQLAKRRGIDKNHLLEYMGSTELAANVFRLAMTKEQLKKDDIRGQQASEAVHTKVGETVREIVKSHAGPLPS